MPRRWLARAAGIAVLIVVLPVVSSGQEATPQSSPEATLAATPIATTAPPSVATDGDDRNPADFLSTVAQVAATFAAILGGFLIALGADVRSERRKLVREIAAYVTARTGLEMEENADREASDEAIRDTERQASEEFSHFITGRYDSIAYGDALGSVADQVGKYGDDFTRRQEDRSRRRIQLIHENAALNRSHRDAQHRLLLINRGAWVLTGFVLVGVGGPVILMLRYTGSEDRALIVGVGIGFVALLMATIGSILWLGIGFPLPPWGKPEWNERPTDTIDQPITPDIPATTAAPSTTPPPPTTTTTPPTTSSPA